MRWEDERYVRLYTRDTTSWVLGPWEARAVLGPVMRRLDRAGVLDLGDDGMEGLAALALMPFEVVEAGMAWWLKRGTFELVDGRLVMPNFLEAQEAAASDAKRAREHRERARDIGRAPVTKRDGSVTERDDDDTHRDDSSRAVTERHGASRSVTPCCAVPSVPSVPSVPDPPIAPLESKPGKRARGRAAKSLIAEDWQPSAETIALFEREGIDASACVVEFVDHWRGEGESKANWDATFRNRVRWLKGRGQAPMLPPRPPSARPPAVAPDALTGDEARAQFEKLQGILSGVGQPPWQRTGGT